MRPTSVSFMSDLILSLNPLFYIIILLVSIVLNLTLVFILSLFNISCIFK